MRNPFHCFRIMRYTARKLKGPVLENTNEPEVATPTVKRGFVTPKFSGQVHLRALPFMVMGGMGLSARTLARLVPCFQHPVHPMRLKTQTVASLIQPGTKTVTAITHQVSRRAAPANSDPIQLHAETHNALSMAVFYLRQPQANVLGARRKAIQALSALRNLSQSLEA